MAPRKKSQITRAKATKYTKRNHGADQPLADGDNLNGTTQGEITPPEPPKKKGRGPAKIKGVKMDADERPEVWRVGLHEFSCAKDPKLITATITRLALRLMPAPVRSYHAFHDKAKKNLEREFLYRYRYAKDEDPDRCREVLDAIACKRYCEELGTARRKRILRHGWDIEAWKVDVPHWSVAPQHWRALYDIFFTDEWQLVSKQNQHNRDASKGSVSHYAGSATAHRHFEKLTSMNNGKKPTMEELYIHMHCARENGVSPVVAQIIAAEESVNEITENSVGNAGQSSTADEITGQGHEYDISSLQFTTKRKADIYREVKEMRADQANSHLDDITLFQTALGRPSHGKFLGFGSLLQKKMQTATTRERQQQISSSISGLTTSGDKDTFSRSEVDAICKERDIRLAEERAERKRDQEQNLFLFSQLFKMHGLLKPPQAPSSTTELPQEGIQGNIGYLQVQDTTSQPSQEVPSMVHMEFNQDIAGSLQPNEDGSFQALLSAQNGPEIAGNEAAMTNWWANQS